MGHFVTLRLTTLESDLTLIVVKLHACNVPSHFNKKYCVDFIHNLFLFLRGLAEYCIVLPTIEDCRVKHLDSSSRFAGHIRITYGQTTNRPHYSHRLLLRFLI